MQLQYIIILTTYTVNIIVIILTHHVDDGAALLSRVLHHHLAELAVTHLFIFNIHTRCQRHNRPKTYKKQQQQGKSFYNKYWRLLVTLKNCCQAVAEPGLVLPRQGPRLTLRKSSISKWVAELG